MEIAGVEVVAERQRLLEVGVLTLAFLEDARARRNGREHAEDISESEEVQRAD